MAIRGRPKGTTGTPEGLAVLIRALAEVDETPAAIHRRLVDVLGDQAPKDRTIRDIVRKFLVHDGSGVWSVLDASDPGAAQLLLSVLRAVTVYSEGRVSHLTRGEARRIEALRNAVHDLSPLNLWRLARSYVRRALDNQTTEDLDLYVAFAPWLGIDNAAEYAAALAKTRIAAAPAYLPGVPRATRDYDDDANRRARLREIAEQLDIDSPLFKEETGNG